MPAIFAIIGIMLAALSRNPWFFFGFVFLGFHFAIPADEVSSLLDSLHKETDIQRRRELQQELKDLLETNLLLSKLKHGHSQGLAWLSIKETFKLLSILCFALGFVVIELPLAKPVGIILAFAGYFLMGGKRDVKEDEE